MATIAELLEAANRKVQRGEETKALLKTRLTEKGLDVASEENFYNLADKVGEIKAESKTIVNLTVRSNYGITPTVVYMNNNGDVVFEGISPGTTVEIVAEYGACAKSMGPTGAATFNGELKTHSIYSGENVEIAFAYDIKSDVILDAT